MFGAAALARMRQERRTPFSTSCWSSASTTSTPRPPTASPSCGWPRGWPATARPVLPRHQDRGSDRPPRPGPAWSGRSTRLGVDQVDLIQLHNLVEEDEWEHALGPGGAVEALVRARDEGLVRFIGVTGHGLRIAGMHLRSLERFDFDSVLLPYNFGLWQDAGYRRDVERCWSCAPSGALPCRPSSRWPAGAGATTARPTTAGTSRSPSVRPWPGPSAACCPGRGSVPQLVQRRRPLAIDPRGGQRPRIHHPAGRCRDAGRRGPAVDHPPLRRGRARAHLNAVARRTSYVVRARRPRRRRARRPAFF